MHLKAKAIRISHAKFHCNRLTTVQDIQDYVSLVLCIFQLQLNKTARLVAYK